MTADEQQTSRVDLWRRVLVALDSSSESETTIAEASVLAQLWGAELVGIFVEESTVEQAMGLEAVRMVATAGGVLRDVDPASWRRTIRALVRMRRAELSRRAESLELRSSFQVEQGSMAQVLLRTATDLDIVVVSHVRRRRPVRGGGIVALVTAESGAAQVVDLARALAMRAQVPLHVFAVGETFRLKELEGSLVSGADLRLLTQIAPRLVARELRRLGARLVVASGQLHAMDETYLETLRAGLACPLALVR